MSEDIIIKLNLETECIALKQAGHSIREIAKALSNRTGAKISASAVFRFLKAQQTTEKKPIEPGATVTSSEKKYTIAFTNPKTKQNPDIFSGLNRSKNTDSDGPW